MQLLELLLEPHPLQRDRFGRLLQIGRVELREITRNALLQLLAPALHFRLREVLVAVVDRLELAAVDRDAGRREQSDLAADLDEARAHFDGRPVVLPEIGDGLEVWRKPPQQPHHLEIAARLALETPARMHAVEIAVDVELQVNDA